MQKHSHDIRGTLLLVCLGALCASCQQPSAGAPRPPVEAAPPGGPPPLPQPGMTPSTAQRPFSSNGSIRNWNYGPNGDINGFTLDRNVLVMFPPEFGATLASMARLDSRVSISGDSRGVNVQTVSTHNH